MSYILEFSYSAIPHKFLAVSHRLLCLRLSHHRHMIGIFDIRYRLCLWLVFAKIGQFAIA